jgi:hypothetical protein
LESTSPADLGPTRDRVAAALYAAIGRIFASLGLPADGAPFDRLDPERRAALGLMADAALDALADPPPPDGRPMLPTETAAFEVGHDFGRDAGREDVHPRLARIATTLGLAPADADADAVLGAVAARVDALLAAVDARIAALERAADAQTFGLLPADRAELESLRAARRAP